MLDLSYEKKLFKEGYDYVVGIDEVGRGCWAGPMYMCAYIVNDQYELVDGVNDSKKVSKKKRGLIYQELIKGEYLIEKVKANKIDEFGLGKSVLMALGSLIDQIQSKFESKKIKILVDGYFKGDWPSCVEFIVKGDSKAYSIAAAAILAKVERDELMVGIGRKYPEYGFESHVGYGTKQHREALNLCGVTDIHRISYKPVKKLLKM